MQFMQFVTFCDFFGKFRKLSTKNTTKLENSSNLFGGRHCITFFWWINSIGIVDLIHQTANFPLIFLRTALRASEISFENVTQEIHNLSYSRRSRHCGTDPTLAWVNLKLFDKFKILKISWKCSSDTLLRQSSATDFRNSTTVKWSKSTVNIGWSATGCSLPGIILGLRDFRIRRYCHI